MKKNNLTILVIILLSFIIGIYLYPQMPEKVASHWNARGQVDSYMSKFWGLFLMPLILAGLFPLFLLIPQIDPLKENIKKFRKLMKNAKRNWFIGIRTPWTLSSDRVWDKTHKIGGKLFKVAGLIALIGFFFLKHAIFFMIIPAILFSVYTIIYSYVEYQKEKNI